MFWSTAENKIHWVDYTTLTHWGRVTHICISKLSIIGSDNGLSPGRRQAIIWNNVGILSIRTLGTNFSEIVSEIHAFSFKKMHLKMSSAKWRPFCRGLNVLTNNYLRDVVAILKYVKITMKHAPMVDVRSKYRQIALKWIPLDWENFNIRSA